MNKFFPAGARKVPIKIDGERKLHVANELDTPIYVLAAPSMNSAIANLVVGTGKLGKSGAQTGSPSPTATLKSMGDIQDFIKRLELTRLAGRASSDRAGGEALRALGEYLDGNAVLLRPREVQEILKRDLWKQSGPVSIVETLFNSNAISLMLATKELDRFAIFDSGVNDSWIFRHDGVVRAKFGSLWDPDPGAGFIHASRGDRLPSGSWLEPGESLTSANGRYVFIYQRDGNAVVYDVSDKARHKPIWASNTGGSPAWRLELQASGKVVAWSAEGKEAWSDPRSKSPQATWFWDCELIMTNDGVARVMGSTGAWGWDTLWKS